MRLLKKILNQKNMSLEFVKLSISFKFSQIYLKANFS